MLPTDNNGFFSKSFFESLEDRVLFDGVPDATFILPQADAQDAMPAQSQDISQPSLDGPRELILIDAGVQDREQLLAEILATKSESTFEIRLLDANSDGVQQISEILASSDSEYSAVHIISHGDEGEVRLGNSTLSADNLAEYADDLAGWADALTGDADLLFYGCDLAGNAEGEQFIESVSAITGADVAASDDLTGAAELGGDWDLELNVGTVETAALVAENWHGTLLGDADGDGLDHDVDLDDDNDGILDSEEGFRTFTLESDSFPSAPVAINGGDSDNLQTGDVFIVPGVGSNLDARIEFTEVNTDSATVNISDAGRLTISGSGDNELNYVTYQISLVESGSVTAGNLAGTAVQATNVEVFIADVDARNNSSFSDVGGIDTTSGSTPVSTTVGAELSPFTFPAGSGTGAFDLVALTNFGTSDSTNTNPDFGVIFGFDSFDSGTFLHGTTGTGIGQNRGAVFSFSGDAVRDTDGDGIFDHKDLDSDNDGISDLIESGADPSAVDTDGDGAYDGAVDPVTGVPVDANGGVDPVDSDGDGVDDYRDLDSDDDGIADAIEAQPTAGYQTPSIGSDADDDGVVDTFDSSTGFGGDFSTPEDTDGDGVADFLDDDSDNDGVDDIVESGLTPGADNDGDGIADNIAPLSFADTDGIVTDPTTDLDNEVGDTSEVGYLSLIHI